MTRDWSIHSITGGLGTSVVTSALGSTEIQDQAIGAFSYTGALDTAGDEHSATLLNNGQVQPSEEIALKLHRLVQRGQIV